MIFILFLFNLLAHKGEFFAPPVVMCAVFLLSVLCTICNINRWNVSIHWNTLWIIIGGLSTFSIVGIYTRLLFSRQIYKKQNNKTSVQSHLHPVPIHTAKWMVYLLIVIMALVAIIYILEIVKIVSRYQGKVPWTQLMYYFRIYIGFGTKEDQIPFLVRQIYAACVPLGYVCTYIIIYNYLATKKINLYMLILGIISIILVMMNATRMEIFRIIIIGITVYEILLYRFKGKHILISFKMLMRALLGLTMFCVLFVFLKQIIGRIDDRNPFYYVTYYIGQSVQNLDVYLQKAHDVPDIFGKETFYGFNRTLFFLTGDPKYNYLHTYEFITINSLSTGNAYTTFRAFWNDFGTVGVIILSAIFSWIVCSLYYYQYTEKFFYCNKGVSLIVLGYAMSSVWLAFYADFFFMIFSAIFLRTLVGIYIWYFLLVRFKIKKSDINVY